MERKLYVSSDIGLRMRSSPEIKPDNILAVLPYGQEVSVIRESGKWFEAISGNKQGWVSSEYLVENSPIIHSTDGQLEENNNIPTETILFITGAPNHANDDNVIKLRKIINDEFVHNQDGADLQCVEYVQYRVKEKLGVIIQWPNDRPRHGGLWAGIFEKNNRYKVTGTPKADCAASFANPSFNPPYGHVAFVEEVLNDESIRISEANWPSTKKKPEGEYNKRTIPKAKWQGTYGIRFIDFS